MLWKKSEINDCVTWGNCYFWNIFYIDLINKITNNDEDIDINLITENDFHSFLNIKIWNNNTIIDPTWRDKTLKKLNLKKSQNYTDKSHFIKNIWNNISNMETLKNNYNLEKLDDYMEKSDAGNIISIWIRINKINYQLIIDNKNNTEDLDVVFLKNGTKQKKILPLNKINIENKSISEIFNFLTKWFIFENEDIEILLKMLKKSHYKKFLKVLTLPKKNKS